MAYQSASRKIEINSAIKQIAQSGFLVLPIEMLGTLQKHGKIHFQLEWGMPLSITAVRVNIVLQAILHACTPPRYQHKWLAENTTN